MQTTQNYSVCAPLDIVFQEQSYSSLHSWQGLAWDPFRGIIADPCDDWLLHGCNCKSVARMRQLENLDSAGANADCCMTH